MQKVCVCVYIYMVEHKIYLKFKTHNTAEKIGINDMRLQLRFTKFISINGETMNQHWLEMLSWFLPKNFKDNFIIHFVKRFLLQSLLLPPFFVYILLPVYLFIVGFIFFQRWHITFSCAMNQQHKCGKSL